MYTNSILETHWLFSKFALLQIENGTVSDKYIKHGSLNHRIAYCCELHTSMDLCILPNVCLMAQDGQTPLSFAVWEGNNDLVKWLVEEKKANLQNRDKVKA
jgi:hypothetical protein